MLEVVDFPGEGIKHDNIAGTTAIYIEVRCCRILMRARIEQSVGQQQNLEGFPKAFP